MQNFSKNIEISLIPSGSIKDTDWDKFDPPSAHPANTTAYAERCLKEMIRICRTRGKIYVGYIFNAYLKEVYLQQCIQPPPLLERLKQNLRQLLGKPDHNYDSLFLYPYELEQWAMASHCQDFKALVSLSRKKPLLFRMYRFDVLIVK